MYFYACAWLGEFEIISESFRNISNITKIIGLDFLCEAINDFKPYSLSIFYFSAFNRYK